MINIVDKQTEYAIWPLWRQAFRPLFLAGAAFSAFSITMWTSFLSGWISFAPYANPHFWHAHEMVFGFAGAIIVGFLLTAVQNWTGIRATHGRPLMLLVSSWLLGRLVLLFNPTIAPCWIAAIDISFFLLAAGLFARLVLLAKNQRNLFFVPVLLLLAGCNLLSHAGIILNEPQYVQQGLYAAIMQITLMMTVVAGRVFPMFTANGTKTPKAAPLKVLEWSCIASCLLAVVIFLLNLQFSITPSVLTGFFGLASGLHIYRAVRWRPWVTLRTPLVWSLHFAYWFIPLGFALLALHFGGLGIPISSGIHALTAGAMGSLILAMIARISLGHSGRPLKVHPLMCLSFVLILSAGLARVAIGMFPASIGSTGYLISGSAWTLAYLIFLTVYSKILLTPRADGHPG